MAAPLSQVSDTHFDDSECGLDGSAAMALRLDAEWRPRSFAQAIPGSFWMEGVHRRHATGMHPSSLPCVVVLSVASQERRILGFWQRRDPPSLPFSRISGSPLVDVNLLDPVLYICFSVEAPVIWRHRSNYLVGLRYYKEKRHSLEMSRCCWSLPSKSTTCFLSVFEFPKT